MVLKVPDVGEIALIDLLRAAWGNTLRIGLYVGGAAPADGDTLASYTSREATFPGYARGTIINWTAAAADGLGRAFTQADFVTFTAGLIVTPENIRGYFVMNAAQTALYWAEADPAGDFTINLIGQTYRVRPRFTGKSEF